MFPKFVEPNMQLIFKLLEAQSVNIDRQSKSIGTVLLLLPQRSLTAFYVLFLCGYPSDFILIPRIFKVFI